MEKPFPVVFRFFPSQCYCMFLNSVGEQLEKVLSSTCTLWPIISLQMSTPSKINPKCAKNSKKKTTETSEGMAPRTVWVRVT